MDLKDILAGNVKALMARHAHLNTQMKLHKATQKIDPETGEVIPGLTQSTIQRVLTGQVYPTLDTVQRIADAFAVSPTSLLVDEIHPISNDVNEAKLLTLWRRLSDSDKDKALAFIAIAATDVAPKPNFASREPIDPGMIAPVARASARTMKKHDESEEFGTSNSTTRKENK